MESPWILRLGAIRSCPLPLTLIHYPPTVMMPHIASSGCVHPYNGYVACTYDIVPSLGPQSQVLNPAEASVFVQSSVPSTRFAIATPYKYLFPYSSTKSSHKNSHAPAIGARHPLHVLAGLCPTHNPQLPTLRSKKGSARPAVTYPQLLYMWRNLPARKDYTIYISLFPNLTHRSNSKHHNSSKYGNQGIR